MAVTSREIRSPRRMSSIAMPKLALSNSAYIVTSLLAILAIYVLVSAFISWGQTLLDDWQYGRPRTFHLIAEVGRPEETVGPTRLIAMNLDRQVLILEIPGGDVTKTRTIVGPYLVGANENLTPVTMRLTDMNGDGMLDLVVGIKNEEIVYLNRGDSFGLVTAEERQQILRQLKGR
ncbi:MAG: VCBS repeat-containing protein [Chloroflexus sp.]|nr:VCBS repeat-containing protein [Chloroflexus sp.]MBO9373295.1 VCBS repeat-containing protein [Chloroflexus sp.]